MKKPSDLWWVNYVLRQKKDHLQYLQTFLKSVRIFQDIQSRYAIHKPLFYIPLKYLMQAGMTREEIEKAATVLKSIQNRFFVTNKKTSPSIISGQSKKISIIENMSIFMKSSGFCKEGDLPWIEGVFELPLELIEKQVNTLLSSKHATRIGDRTIDYDPESGTGYFGNQSFKIKYGSPEYKVLTALYRNIGQMIQRYDILVLIGFYKEGESPSKIRRGDETYAINAVAKSLRKKTRLSTQELVLNTGNLTLTVNRSRKLPQT